MPLTTVSTILEIYPPVYYDGILLTGVVQNIESTQMSYHCAKTYIPTTWESIGYADGNVLNPAN